MNDIGWHPVRRWEVVDVKGDYVDARFARVLVAYAHAMHQRAFFGTVFYVRRWTWRDLVYDRQPGNLLCRLGLHSHAFCGRTGHDPRRGVWLP